jgi:2-phospho-L-lactate guanylyltransferase
MKTFAIVPVKKFENAKRRLSQMLLPEERIHLSFLMLSNTLNILVNARALAKVVVVSTDSRAKEIASRHGAAFIDEETESDVNSAVAIANKYCIQKGADATMVVPQDIPLLDSKDILRACDLAKEDNYCIVICPSLRYDGTSLLLRKPPAIIKTYYDSDSYRRHIEIAKHMGIPVKILFSQKLMQDIDTPEDVKQFVKYNIEKHKLAQFLNDKVFRPKG